MLGDSREDYADFIEVRHIDAGSTHARQFPPVQPLAGEATLLEGELQGSFDNDSPVADGALRQLTILERRIRRLLRVTWQLGAVTNIADIARISPT